MAPTSQLSHCFPNPLSPRTKIKTPFAFAMGLHLVAFARLNLLSSSRNMSPIVGGLILPFLVKLLFSFRFVRGAYSDVIYASRLFFFQLSRITFDDELGNLGIGSRWERAVRLVHERLAPTARTPAEMFEDEESLRTLSMLAL